MVVLFTIDCLNCKRLEQKLEESGIGYAVCRDKKLMEKEGISVLPVLVVDEHKMGFKEAMKWVNERKETV